MWCHFCSPTLCSILKSQHIVSLRMYIKLVHIKNVTCKTQDMVSNKLHFSYELSLGTINIANRRISAVQFKVVKTHHIKTVTSEIVVIFIYHSHSSPDLSDCYPIILVVASIKLARCGSAQSSCFITCVIS